MAYKIWYKHFAYQTICFKLTNILVIFEKYIDKILAKKLNIFIFVYGDSIFIYIVNKKKTIEK